MNSAAEYWKANLRLMTILLVIWFVVSYLFGIILVEPLNAIKIGGYKLGFWFAQQGSIYVFVVLIFFYAVPHERAGPSSSTSTKTKGRPDYMDLQTLTYIVVGATFALYIGIAIWARAATTGEFYVAGRGVHPVVNGMATAADWMSRRVLHLDGRPDRLHGLRRLGLPDGLDRRLRAAGHAAGARTCASSASSPCPSSSATATTPRRARDRGRHLPDRRLVHLRHRPDEGRRRGLLALPRGRLRRSACSSAWASCSSTPCSAA